DHLINDLGWTISGDREGTCTLGLENHHKKALTVYPNPAREKINISGLNGNEKLVLYNLNGQKVHSWKAEGETLPLEIGFLEDGLYFLDVIFKNGDKFHHKVIKN